MGVDCYINDYFDRDTSEAAKDYTCGDVTRDNHRGVDFALLDLQQMRDGVDVIAVAPGTVRGVRDGMEDTISTQENDPALQGKACGNGVAIDHGGGWVTQYCHLKKGTIAVAEGQRVAMGAMLGEVGLSGQSNYPHVHLTTYKDRLRVDPFNPDMADTCGIADDQGLWLDPLPYKPGGFVRIGLAGTPPKFSDVKEGLDATPFIPATADVLVAWAHGYTVRKGDVIKATITGPDGTVFFDGETTLNRNRKYVSLNYLGKKRRAPQSDLGTYEVTMKLIRGGVVIDEKTTRTLVISP